MPSGSSRHAPVAAAASAFVARFNGTLALALPRARRQIAEVVPHVGANRCFNYG